MKVVHIVASDTGGAARAALRISKALQISGVESYILVLRKKNNDDNVIQVFKNKISWNIFRIVRRIHTDVSCKINKEGKIYYSDFGVDLLKNKVVRGADVINLHWVSDATLSTKQIANLVHSGKKVVWTMHDMFPFTAGCYYDNGCGLYKKGCVDCQFVQGDKKGKKLLKKQAEKKLQLCAKRKIAFVGCSEWITNCAKESAFTKNSRIVNIPNPIDTEMYKPKNADVAKRELSLETDKKIILFGAVSADSDKRKGFQFLKNALKKLDPAKYMLVIFGGGTDGGTIDDRFEIVKVGRIADDVKLASLYSSADVFVAPSVQENLSNAVMESLSCGTPVVAFDVGGMRDMIEHNKNGYLANPFDVDDLADGIKISLENKGSLSKYARESVLGKFTMKRIGSAYKQFYETL